MYVQVYNGSTDVWGSCAGIQLYKQYAVKLCDYATQDQCSNITVTQVTCTWLPEYDSEVVTNPLNFSKPCVLAATTAPVESLFIGHGSFASAVMDMQADCANYTDEASCSQDLKMVFQQSVSAALTDTNTSQSLAV